ncbi:hypothetical protein MFIFM68171_07905 [Madurella fahalii]|uniref:Enoyl reductase (ER) domain-containing protein n=1 Tax=Madurella fahalii TaxID=1157608 RepID=A0ABQ0GJ23_9PEZI
MKEALVGPGPRVQIVDSPIPEPNPDQLLIKVVVSGSNPKDWKIPEIWTDKPTNEGDDIAGIVEKVGANVFEFKPGDRVAAFHQMRTPHGSYAEYAIAWQHTTFHIPAKISFEEAAAIPLAAMTAAIGLYNYLGLPQPWSPPSAAAAASSTPLLIYGAATSVGFYALQLALRSNIHPLICVAGRACDYVRPLLDPSKGDVVLDYRQGDEALVRAIVEAAHARPPQQQQQQQEQQQQEQPQQPQQKRKPLRHVLDAVSEGSSVGNIGNVFRALAAGAEEADLGPEAPPPPAPPSAGRVTFVLSGEKKGLPEGVEHSITMVGDVHKAAKDFGYVYFRYFARGLQEGWFRPHRTEVVPGGLGGVQTALANLKAGKASAVKYVFRIDETEGVGK